jgi:hypothetical protein
MKETKNIYTILAGKCDENGRFSERWEMDMKGSQKWERN